MPAVPPLLSAKSLCLDSRRCRCSKPRRLLFALLHRLWVLEWTSRCSLPSRIKLQLLLQWRAAAEAAQIRGQWQEQLQPGREHLLAAAGLALQVQVQAQAHPLRRVTGEALQVPQRRLGRPAVQAAQPRLRLRATALSVRRYHLAEQRRPQEVLAQLQQHPLVLLPALPQAQAYAVLLAHT